MLSLGLELGLPLSGCFYGLGNDGKGSGSIARVLYAGPPSLQPTPPELGRSCSEVVAVRSICVFFCAVTKEARLRMRPGFCYRRCLTGTGLNCPDTEFNAGSGSQLPPPTGFEKTELEKAPNHYVC
jgi:hypothetical protein